ARGDGGMLRIGTGKVDFDQAVGPLASPLLDQRGLAKSRMEKIAARFVDARGELILGKRASILELEGNLKGDAGVILGMDCCAFEPRPNPVMKDFEQKFRF